MREGEGLEFERVTFFSDAVFAIAMTLLVVGLTVPELTREQDLSQEMLLALQERQPEILSFFIGFAILGFYWTAHHTFFASFRAASRSLIRVNLGYLAIVAFLPFPAALIGRYENNPVAFVLFALVVAAISGLEVVLLMVAFAQDLTKVSFTARGSSLRRYRLGRAGRHLPAVDPGGLLEHLGGALLVAPGYTAGSDLAEVCSCRRG